MKRLVAASVLVVGCRGAAPAEPSPSEAVAAPAKTAPPASTEVDPRPRYRTMLSAPCATVDARTVACMPRHGWNAERHVLDDELGPGEHLVHLEGARARLCALVRPSGRVVCWSEEEGPSRPGETEPAFDLSVVQGAIDFDLFEHGVCMLSEDGQVLCAGKNGDGQLGDGSRQDRDTLEPVELPGKAVDIEAAWNSACAQLSSGDVYCWGNNGATDDPRRTRPTKVRGLPANVTLTSPDRAVTQAGQHWRWHTLDHVPDQGYTTAEPIEGPNALSLTCWRVRDELWCEAGPDKVPERLLEDVREVDLQHGAYCARLEDRSVWCVGHRLRLTSPAPEFDPLEPTRVPGLTAVSSVVMSLQGACAIHDGGKVSCWGDAPTTHFPNQNPRFVGTPQVVSLAGPAQDLVVAKDGACARVDGRAHCWGRNGKILDLGLADAITTLGDQPCAVAGSAVTCMQQGPAWYRDPDLRKVTTQASFDPHKFGHACRVARGDVRCGYSQAWITCSSDAPETDCRLQTESDELQSFDPPLKFRRGKDRLLAGGRVACVFADSGRLRCRGNSYGRPLEVIRDDIVQASAGLETVCAVDRSGQIACWGRLGLEARESPIIVDDIDDARSVHVGGSVACAIREDGSLWCWGGSSSGERGRGGESWSESWVPIRLEALQGK